MTFEDYRIVSTRGLFYTKKMLLAGYRRRNLSRFLREIWGLKVWKIATSALEDPEFMKRVAGNVPARVYDEIDRRVFLAVAEESEEKSVNDLS